MCLVLSLIMTVHLLLHTSRQKFTHEKIHTLWSPNPSDELWLPHEKTHRPEDTPVVIVEEHYEGMETSH